MFDGTACVPGGVATVDGLSNMSSSLVKRNRAVHGGATYTSTHAAIAVAHTVLANNSATAGGGAMLFAGVPDGSALSNTMRHEWLARGRSAVGVTWSHLAIHNNTAAAGGGVFWQLPLPYSSALPLPHVSCTQCLVSHNSGRDVATTGVSVQWLPLSGTAVASAVLASGISIIAHVADSVVPRAAVVDALGQTARLDNTTDCSLALVNSSDDTSNALPRSLRVERGILNLDDVVVVANVGASMELHATCTLLSPTSGAAVATVEATIDVEQCSPGWDLSAQRVCRLCLPGFYSPFGRVCLPCPTGGDCVQPTRAGDTQVGQ